MNFYQSPLWRTIQQDIYKKPTFDINIKGEKYFGIVKRQRRLMKDLNRYMVHWVQSDISNDPDGQFAQELTRIQRDFKRSRGDIFFQFGLLDTVWSGTTNEIKKDKELVSTLTTQKATQDTKMRDDYQLLPAWREHMPDTTVQLPLTKGITEIRTWYSSSGKRYINKAKKEDLSFEITTSEATWKTFWRIRYSMAFDKAFTVIPEDIFLELMRHLTESWQWRLMLAKKWNRIVSGSVVLDYTYTGHKQLIYLYGATNREYGNIWGHYRLTDQILKRGAQEWYELYDLLWVAPPGRDDHYLSWVTRFKQAFGGNTIVSVGNYDSVYNSKLYRAMQALKNKGWVMSMFGKLKNNKKDKNSNDKK